MANVLRHLPELEGMELGYIQGLLKNMDDDQASLFCTGLSREKKRCSNDPNLDLDRFLWICRFTPIHFGSNRPWYSIYFDCRIVLHRYDRGFGQLQEPSL